MDGQDRNTKQSYRQRRRSARMNEKRIGVPCDRGPPSRRRRVAAPTEEMRRFYTDSINNPVLVSPLATSYETYPRSSTPTKSTRNHATITFFPSFHRKWTNREGTSVTRWVFDNIHEETCRSTHIEAFVSETSHSVRRGERTHDGRTFRVSIFRSANVQKF